MATFQERLNEALGPRGYENCMRRSVQTVILYEAHRCIASRVQSLRPFQRKLAMWDQAIALVKQSELLPHQREEVLWRTGTSKALLDADTAWKRMKISEKELEKLINERVKPCFVSGMSHSDLYKEFIQNQFESQTGHTGKEFPNNWEHSHNNIIMTYKIYYNGLSLDPNFPVAQPVVEINVPHQKPTEGILATRAPATLRYAGPEIAPAASGETVPPAAAAEGSIYAVDKGESPTARRLILQEVKDHMDLLEMFTGVVHADVLKKRKRELFEALPPVPPSATKRQLARRNNGFQ